MKQPSLALHSHDVPGHKYQMKWTWQMPPKATARDVAYWILYAADHSKEMGLENVILNCHGGPGVLGVGGEGASDPQIDLSNVGVFSLLKDTDLGTIWLVSCDVAAVEKGPGGQDGKRFCAELAKAADCEVVAAGVDQRVDVSFYLRMCPWGCIDDFEGVAYRFYPSGGYTWYSW
jgi:hypothetical protein